MIVFQIIGRLIIYDNFNEILTQLFTITSFIDWLIGKKEIYTVSYDIIAIFFDPITVENIVSKRKQCMKYDSLYAKKFVYAHVDEIMYYLQEFYGLAAVYSKIVHWVKGHSSGLNP